QKAAKKAMAFPNAFGLTVRYAMKAAPNAAIIRVLGKAGLHIDASSGYEAERAIYAGIPAEHIQITAQQFPENLEALVRKGVRFNACSLLQLASYGQRCEGGAVSIRLNPGMGSGHNNRTNVGGTASSFGIWHAYLDEAMAIAERYNLTIQRVHTHIGSGSDPAVWQKVALMSLEMCAKLPSVTVLNLGGGFKVGRVEGEETTDLAKIGEPIQREFEKFAQQHGRALHLEIEPGGFLVGNAGVLIASVMDVVDTGPEGYRFIKIDAGMTEIIRPSMYGSQHPIRIAPMQTDAQQEARDRSDYLVVGHCCESGDILTPKAGDPEGLQARCLLKPRVGDAVIIGGAGAYCSGMSAKNYNSFPEAPEVMQRTSGEFSLIRRKQTMAQLIENEIGIDLSAHDQH
ncbi:MAG: diaminopimelate decarboxylase, partial [Gammaproteobacteria bacterium]